MSSREIPKEIGTGVFTVLRVVYLFHLLRSTQFLRDMLISY